MVGEEIQLRLMATTGFTEFRKVRTMASLQPLVNCIVHPLQIDTRHFLAGQAGFAS